MDRSEGMIYLEINDGVALLIGILFTCVPASCLLVKVFSRQLHALLITLLGTQFMHHVSLPGDSHLIVTH